MNQRERILMGRFQQCLGTMRGLNPKNPADLKAKLKNHKLLLDASDRLWYALSSIGYEDYTTASDELEDAERILAPEPEPFPVSGTAEGRTER